MYQHLTKLWLDDECISITDLISKSPLLEKSLEGNVIASDNPRNYINQFSFFFSQYPSFSNFLHEFVCVSFSLVEGLSHFRVVPLTNWCEFRNDEESKFQASTHRNHYLKLNWPFSFWELSLSGSSLLHLLTLLITSGKHSQFEILRRALDPSITVFGDKRNQVIGSLNLFPVYLKTVFIQYLLISIVHQSCWTISKYQSRRKNTGLKRIYHEFWLMLNNEKIWLLSVKCAPVFQY